MRKILFSFLSVYMTSPEVDKHPGGDEYGVDAHQALHQHQGHTNTLQYHSMHMHDV
jgi:hypothetical protein